MSRKAAEPPLQAQPGDQQGAHAKGRRREPLQVSTPFVVLCFLFIQLVFHFLFILIESRLFAYGSDKHIRDPLSL